MTRDLVGIMAVVRGAARELTGAHGATFVLRDADMCYYADENAISPLWKGRRFPMSSCISGWAMLNKQAVIIEDIYEDARIPHEAYRPTFVKSLAMVPIRASAPIGAIGNYWAESHRATEGEVKLLQALADLISVAMENTQLYGELQRRIEEAHEALRAREEFLAVAAHELRTPLTAVLLQLQRLERLSAGDAERGQLSRCVASASRGAQRLGALLDGLLDASRLPHGALALQREELDLVALARGVMDCFAPVAERAQCPLRLEAQGPVCGTWDRLRLEQVLMNLLSNALKFGAGKPIEVAIERRGDSAHLEVRDHGLGIAPELTGRLFERFGRARPISHYAGLGLGLYLAREVIEAHGGTIAVESEPDRGCAFRLELPLRPSNAEGAGGDSGELPGASA